MKVIRIVLCLMLVGLFLNSCSQYEEGPGFSLYSKGKRVNGTWFFSSVKYNDRDSSELYTQGAIDFVLVGDGKDSGTFNWNKLAYSFDPSNLQRGEWSFQSEMDSFQMLLVNYDQSAYDTVTWGIQRLSYDEWWMERQYDDTTVLSWRLWKRVY